MFHHIGFPAILIQWVQIFFGRFFCAYFFKNVDYFCAMALISCSDDSTKICHNPLKNQMKN